MGKKKAYSLEAVLTAIRGSGAIISTIANRLDCDWHTAKKYVNNWEATKKAFEAEEEQVLDLCIGVLVRSIRSGDTADAKWFLSTKGRSRGFSPRSTLDLNVSEIKITEVEVEVDLDEEERIADFERSISEEEV